MADPRDNAQLGALVSIAREAAALVRAHYAEPIAVELKGPDDPVTPADREANELICRALGRQFPAAAVVGEESAPVEAAAIERLNRTAEVFYVDPLDGTREFIARNGEFSVLIGLCVAGRPRLGVVALPAEGSLLAGAVDEGAYLVAADGTQRLLHVAWRSALAEATLLVSRSRPPPLAQAVRRLAGVRRVHLCGSVGVKIARMLAGQADGYLHVGPGLKRWDCCGPEAVLRAAAGEMTDLAGRALAYRSASWDMAGGLLASSPPLHATLLGAVHAAEGAARRD